MKNERCNLWFVVILISVFTAMLQGCENNDPGIDDETFYSRLYADSVYLGFEGDLLDPLVIWGNMDIYSPAYERMRKHLRFKDNQLQWDIQNGEEMKISENIFNYITMMWNADNEMLKSGKYDLKLGRMYYEVVSKELKMLSRAVGKRTLKMNDSRSFDICWEIYKTMLPGECMCDWVEYGKNFKPDNTGGAYIRGTLEDEPNWEKVMYYVSNACVTSKDYRCELNIYTTPGGSDYHTPEGNVVNVLMKKNCQHAPILSIQLVNKLK